MGLPRPRHSPGPVVRAGTPGGAIRPSSGYAFRRIQTWAARCADALVDRDEPLAGPPDPPARSLMDRIFLRAFTRDAGGAPDDFSRMAGALDGDGFRAAYDIPVRNGRAGEVVEVAETTLPPEQQAMFRARLTAANNIGSLRCTPRYNAVVLDDPDSDGWLVWLLASTNQPNQLILTGHYRFRISADGTEVLRRDQLSATCIIQTVDPAQGQLAALNVSHIVSPQPIETHVFASLLYRLPIYVVAGDKLYGIVGARFREIRR
jgi:hypothetical protein